MHKMHKMHTNAQNSSFVGAIHYLEEALVSTLDSSMCAEER